MKYKIGDVVLLHKKREDVYYADPMMKYLGKFVTIRDTYQYGYMFQEDGGIWLWREDDIKCKIRENNRLTD